MRRAELLRKIRQAARKSQVDFELIREGGSHSIFQCGLAKVIVPRHGELNELTARGIMKDLAGELGEGWWK
jgi:mRNA interferase HicA